jgi:hypothetical protein
LRHSAYLVTGRNELKVALARSDWTKATFSHNQDYRPIVNSRRFGDPLPGLTILLAVAFAVSALCTVAGLAVGWPAR